MTIANTVDRFCEQIVLPTDDGIQLHYFISGLKTHHTLSHLILMVHGAGGSHQQFDSVIPVLNTAGFWTLTCDLRHHGLSQPVKNFAQTCKLDFQLMIGDLKRALRWVVHQYSSTQNNPIGLVLCGLSMGGMLCQDFLCKTSTEEFEILGYSPVALVAMGCGSISMPSPRIDWMDDYVTITFEDSDMKAAREAIGLSAIQTQSRLDAQKALQNVSDEALFQCLQACAKSLHSAQLPVARIHTC